MQYEHLECEIFEGTARLTLLDSEVLALGDLCDEFIDLLLRLQDDPRVRAFILSDGLHPFDLSAGVETVAQLKCAGRDFGELAPQIDNVRRVVTAIQECPLPVVAAAAGCVREGGFGLFMAADCRIAASTATFQPPDVARGLLPEWGLIHTLPRLIGPSRALELLWSGRTVDATEAARIGLVDRLVPGEQWDDELDTLSARLSSLPQPSVRLAKLGSQHAGQLDLTSMLSFEYEAQQQCWDSLETSEGMAAFLDGRPPSFEIPPTEAEDEDM